MHAYKFLKFVPNLQNFSSWQTFPLHSLVTCSVSPTKIFRKTFRVKYSIIYFFQKLLCKGIPLDPLKTFFSFEFWQTHNSRQQRLVNPLATGKKNSKNEFFLGIDKLLRTVCCNCVAKIKKRKNLLLLMMWYSSFHIKKSGLKSPLVKF